MPIMRIRGITPTDQDGVETGGRLGEIT